MSRGGFKIIRCNEQHEKAKDSRDHAIPSWMGGIASKAEQILEKEEQRKKAVTVVDHARERQVSIHEQMYAIMNGKKPLYSSVEEAVTDYQKKTGLIDHLKNIQAESSVKEAAEHILSVTAESDSPIILESYPYIGKYIDNITSSNPHLSIPAIIYMIAENFESDGVGSRELDDPNLARYINKILINKAPVTHEDYGAIGRDDVDSTFKEDDAFGLLRPTGR